MVKSVADLALLALTGASLAEVEEAAAAIVQSASAQRDTEAAELAHAVVAAARRRLEGEDEVLRSREQLEAAQRVGRMGSYEWNVATGTSVWSDELYRIYGVEPQSFEGTRERLLEFVHPDDRERVEAALDAAFAAKGEYHTMERVLRADGTMRLLDTWGEAVIDDTGTVVGLRGICRDVTEQAEAEEAARSSRDRLAAVVGSTPDALLVVGRDGVIREANNQVTAVLGYQREELIGTTVEALVPERYRSVHENHRSQFFGDPHPRSMGVGLDLFARRKDGTEIPVDVALGALTDGEGGLAVAFVRDISERRRVEELAARLREADVARRHALEINDNVVQGIVTALLRLELDDTGESEVVTGLRTTLDAARGIISDLLGEGDIEPGALVRTVPAEGGA